MNWRDQMRQRPASFRGVRFEHISHDGDAGRRIAEHEFPKRDKLITEDMGKRARRWTIEAYVIGPDYMTRRDALLRAVEEEGPGPLIHPWVGEVMAVCLSCRFKESSQNGGMANFTLTFVEADIQPALSGDPEIGADAASLMGKLINFVIFRMGNTYRPSAAAGIGDVVGARLDQVIGWLRQRPGIAFHNLRAQNTLGQLRNVLMEARQTSDVAAFASSWATQFRSALPADAVKRFAAAGDIISRSRQALSQLPAAPSGSAGQRSENERAILVMTINLAITAQAEAALNINHATRDDAETLRDALLEQITDWAEQNDSETWRLLTQLRGALARDLTIIGGGKARRRLIRLDTPLPAVAVSYRLYDDVTKDGVIVSENRVRHPGWVAAGVDLRVSAP